LGADVDGATPRRRPTRGIFGRFPRQLRHRFPDLSAYATKMRVPLLRADDQDYACERHDGAHWHNSRKLGSPTGTAPHRILVSGIQVVEVGGAVVLLADRARLLAHMTRQEDLAIRSRNGFRHARVRVQRSTHIQIFGEDPEMSRAVTMKSALLSSALFFAVGGSASAASVTTSFDITTNGNNAAVSLKLISFGIPIQLAQAAQPPREVAGHGWRRRAGCRS
jgi:hypothetical protein